MKLEGFRGLGFEGESVAFYDFRGLTSTPHLDFSARPGIRDDAIAAFLAHDRDAGDFAAL
jgi:hypothetical protein